MVQKCMSPYAANTMILPKLSDSRLIEVAECLALGLFVEALDVLAFGNFVAFGTIETLRYFRYYSVATFYLYGLATLTVAELHLAYNRDGCLTWANHCALLHCIHIDMWCVIALGHPLLVTATF